MIIIVGISAIKIKGYRRWLCCGNNHSKGLKKSVNTDESVDGWFYGSDKVFWCYNVYTFDVPVIKTDNREKQQFNSTHKDTRIFGHGDRRSLYHYHFCGGGYITAFVDTYSKCHYALDVFFVSLYSDDRKYSLYHIR